MLNLNQHKGDIMSNKQFQSKHIVYSFKQPIVVLMCALTLLLSACTPQAQNPNNPSNPNNPQNPIIDETDPNQPLTKTPDVIKNLGSSKASFSPNETIIAQPLYLERINDVSTTELLVRILLKKYQTLAQIKRDFPSLENSKTTNSQGIDVYTFVDDLTLIDYPNNLVLTYKEVSFSLNDLFFHHLNLNNEAQQSLVVTQQFVALLSPNQKVQSAYFISSLAEIAPQYNDFILDAPKELALTLQFGDVILMNIENNELKPIDVSSLYSQLDALVYAKLDGTQFNLYLKEHPSTKIINKTTLPLLMMIPEKLFAPMYDHTYGTGNNPLIKIISTFIDPITSKAMIKVNYMLDDGLSPLIQITELHYNFTDIEEIDALTLQNIKTHYDSSITSKPFLQKDLILYRNAERVIDLNNDFKDIGQQLNPSVSLKPNEEEDSMTKAIYELNGLNVTFEWSAFTQIFKYEFTDTTYSLNKQFMVGLSKQDLLTLIGQPDVENNNGLIPMHFSEDERWVYYVSNEEGFLLNRYYGFLKVTFIFEDDVVIKMIYEYYVTSI